ncbi:MAG: histidinol-phosphate aminotransferase family protein [Calditerrivibrio sp.]|nr:histidinol-phosphate aminotransferase family protein [Calditerrivibrio sp.]
MIHGHGGDTYLFDIKYDFSSNIIPPKYNKKLLSLIPNIKIDPTRYPEPDARTITTLFQHRFDLPDRSSIALNGSVEGIYLWVEAYKKCRFLLPTSSFAEYEDAVKRFDAPYFFTDIADLKKHIDIADAIIINNPHNPHGYLHDKDHLISLIRDYEQKLFLIDEAYIDIVGEDYSLLEQTKLHKNLFILRSMTKIFSIPGIRLGFLVTHPSNYERLMNLKPPWTVNILAYEVGKLILEQYDELYPELQEYKKITESFYNSLNGIKGIKVLPSSTNFFLCRSNICSATLKKELIAKHKILIRDASNFRELTPYHFRISSQTEEANTTLINALKFLL